MCSIDYEMLISHSPPVFSYSPPTRPSFADYPAFRVGDDVFHNRTNRSPLRGLHHSYSFNGFQKLSPARFQASPKRPCLVVRTSDESCSSSSDEDTLSPTRLKKKVVFADDRGMSLTHVRIMSEPSNVPPLWSLQFLAEVTRGINADPVGQKDRWEVTFAQPASDYVAFRKRLDTEKVSLENVIVKENEDVMVGTVKVSNLSFEKEVLIRSSINSWINHEDAFCEYVPNNLAPNVSPAYVIYDTFSFKMPLPPKSKRLEFCVCFRCDGTDYWDNNHNANYILVKKMSSHLHKSLSNDDLYGRQNERKNQPTIVKCADISTARMESWSEFASWNHLENDNPYW